MSQNKCPKCLNEKEFCPEHQKEQIELEKQEYNSVEINALIFNKQVCKRCGWEFIPKATRDPDNPHMILHIKLPATCPNPACKSPYWNKPRKQEAPAL